MARKKRHFVAQQLESAANLFDSKGKEYDGSEEAYRQYGKVMSKMFPNGIALNGNQDFARFGVYTQMMSKMIRYANNLENGGHEDSLDDLSVYSQILQDLDQNG